jgi:hypothetical protein
MTSTSYNKTLCVSVCGQATEEAQTLCGSGVRNIRECPDSYGRHVSRKQEFSPSGGRATEASGSRRPSLKDLNNYDRISEFLDEPMWLGRLVTELELWKHRFQLMFEYVWLLTVSCNTLAFV